MYVDLGLRRSSPGGRRFSASFAPHTESKMGVSFTPGVRDPRHDIWRARQGAQALDPSSSTSRSSSRSVASSAPTSSLDLLARSTTTPSPSPTSSSSVAARFSPSYSPASSRPGEWARLRQVKTMSGTPEVRGEPSQQSSRRSWGLEEALGMTRVLLSFPPEQCKSDPRARAWIASLENLLDYAHHCHAPASSAPTNTHAAAAPAPAPPEEER